MADEIKTTTPIDMVEVIVSAKLWMIGMRPEYRGYRRALQMARAGNVAWKIANATGCVSSFVDSVRERETAINAQ